LAAINMAKALTAQCPGRIYGRAPVKQNNIVNDLKKSLNAKTLPNINNHNNSREIKEGPIDHYFL